MALLLRGVGCWQSVSVGGGKGNAGIMVCSIGTVAYAFELLEGDNAPSHGSTDGLKSRKDPCGSVSADVADAVMLVRLFCGVCTQCGTA